MAQSTFAEGLNNQTTPSVTQAAAGMLPVALGLTAQLNRLREQMLMLRDQPR